MLRSLFAGVSGLSNHQVKLDVIGNNIANINTVGFKASRVTFREMLSQTIRGASRPTSGSSGGTNPQQIGLGAAIGSIDTVFTQGNMQTTGIMTDLAIEGEGFFILSDGFTSYYTRGGAFSLDGLGHLVNPGNGYKLQGIIADESGNIEHGRGIEDIVLPTSLVVPARATSVVQLMGNLNVDSDAQETITRSEALIVSANGADSALSLYDENGTFLNLRNNEYIQVSGTVGGTTIPDSMMSVTSTTTLSDIADFLETTLRSIDGGAMVEILPDGHLQVNAGGMDINTLSLQVTGNTIFNNAFSFDSAIAAGGSGQNLVALRGPASSADLLRDCYDSNGRQLDLVDGMNITIDGDLGGSAISTTSLPYSSATTTVGDLVFSLRQSFNISMGDVVLDEMGRLQITGDVGSDFAISNIDLSQPGGGSLFDNAFIFTEVQQARDAGSYSATSLVYDSLGTVHDLNVTFTKIYGQNTWNWDVTLEGRGEIIEGGSGTVQFNSDGLLSSFSYSDGSRLLIDPQNGANQIAIVLDPGDIGSMDGLIQFSREFSVRAQDFDGQSMGTLENVSIDRNGVLNGQFTNGVNRDLAQIAMADFNNSSGLYRSGENMFMVSPNSGTPVIVFAGTNARGQLTPGELEMSNVDLASEFTEMIIAQRGFQANARIISVGDQMLNELVNLKK